MKRTYFMDIKLKTGEWVTILYESASRKGTFPHSSDMWNALWRNDVEYDVECIRSADRNATNWTYILNEKNKDEQLYGRLPVMDLR